MSFLLRTSSSSSRLLATRKIASRPARYAAFSTASMRALKEGDRSQESGEHNDHHVKDQLQKQKEGKGHWKPELASNSEEALAADRHSSNESPEELQKKTAAHAEEKHK